MESLIKFNKVGLKKSNGKRYYTNIVAKEDKYQRKHCFYLFLDKGNYF